MHIKATRIIASGDKGSEGSLEARGGSSTASVVCCMGPLPAQKSEEAVREGWQLKIIDKEIDNPAVAGSAVGTIPKGAQPAWCQMIVKTAGVAGGTSATLSVGITGTVGKYCTLGAPTQADSLAKNAKGKQFVDLDSSVLAADEDVKCFPAATGGTSGAGDTLTGAKVRVVMAYWELADLNNYD